MIAPFLITDLDTPSDLKLQDKIIQQESLLLPPCRLSFGVQKEQYKKSNTQCCSFKQVTIIMVGINTMQGYLEKLIPPRILAIVSSSQRHRATGI